MYLSWQLQTVPLSFSQGLGDTQKIQLQMYLISQMTWNQLKKKLLLYNRSVAQSWCTFRGRINNMYSLCSFD